MKQSTKYWIPTFIFILLGFYNQLFFVLAFLFGGYAYSLEEKTWWGQDIKDTTQYKLDELQKSINELKKIKPINESDKSPAAKLKDKRLEVVKTLSNAIEQRKKSKRINY